MAEFTAKDIAALRKQTGAGMLDCRSALEETRGDLEAAKDWLRTQGLAGAAKRAGRAAQDGAVDVLVEGATGAVVELNCETDFVAKGDEFRDTVTALTKLVAEHDDADLESQAFDGETVGEAIKQLGAKVGENVELGRVARYESGDGIVDGYKHMQSDRGNIGVLVEVGGVDAADPKAREIAHVEGRLNGFYKTNVLVEQPFIREPKTTVGKLLGELGKEAAVRRFVRIQVGEE